VDLHLLGEVAGLLAHLGGAEVGGDLLAWASKPGVHSTVVTS
jgi:hypothetical protein